MRRRWRPAPRHPSGRGRPPRRRRGCARRDLSRGAAGDASRESSRAPGLPPPAHAVTWRVEEDATVQVDDLALHPVGVGGTEPGNRGRYLGWLTERPERCRAFHFLEEG